MRNSKLVFLIGSFCILFIGCCGIVPNNTNSVPQSNTSMIINTDANPICKTVIVSEPYQDQECNTVPYTDQQCDNVLLKYTRSEITCRTEGLIGDWIVSSCDITNLDDQGGNFVANVGVNVNNQPLGEQQTYFIYPQQKHTFLYRVQARAQSCYCGESGIPSKQVCRDVLKTRQECHFVTKYRNVEREECN